MKIGYKWEDLYELKGMDVEGVVEWFKAHGEPQDDDYYDYYEDDEILFVGGYWSDGVPVVEFEDGMVARWYRSECWD